MSTVQIYSAQDQARNVEKLFKVNLDAIKKSSPRFVGDPARLIRIAYNTIVYNEDLMKCTQASLMGGVMEALKLGLTLGGPMQEAWLIPFNNSKKGCKEATFIVGYQGYRNIIDRGRSVLDLHPRAVYSGDSFDVKFTERGPILMHHPYYMLPGEKKGALTFVYAVARLRGGGVQTEVLTRADVDAHRNRSRAKDSGPWVSDYDAMALKTVIRVIAKYLPKSSELLARALDLDDRADRGVDQDFDVSGITVFDDSDKAKAPAAGALDKLKDQLAGGPTPEELKKDAAIDAEIAEQDARNAGQK